MKNKKKISKKIIQNAVEKTINESPLDFVRSMQAGVKGFSTGIKGALKGARHNYNLNQVASQLDQFADRVDKYWKIHGGKAQNRAAKLSMARDQTAKQIGNQLIQALSQIDSQVNNFSKTVRQTVPRYVPQLAFQQQNQQQQNQQQGQQQSYQNRILQQQRQQLEPFAQQMNRQQFVPQVQSTLGSQQVSLKGLDKSSDGGLKDVVQQAASSVQIDPEYYKLIQSLNRRPPRNIEKSEFNIPQTTVSKIIGINEPVKIHKIQTIKGAPSSFFDLKNTPKPSPESIKNLDIHEPFELKNKKTNDEKTKREREIIKRLGPQVKGGGWSFSQIDKVFNQIPPLKMRNKKQKRPSARRKSNLSLSKLATSTSKK